MTFKIMVGDCREQLRLLPERSVHCFVTSQPYWGLRDYGVEPTLWGGDPECEHDFECETLERDIRKGLGLAELGKLYRGGGHKQGSEAVRRVVIERGICWRCSCWRGVFGLEPDYRMYVEHAVEIFREVRRVLRDDGTLWANIGDCYATGAGHTNVAGGTAPTDERGRTVDWGSRSRGLRGVPSSMTHGNNGYGTSGLTNGGAYQAEVPRPWSGRPPAGATSTAGYGRGRSDRRGEGTSAARAPAGKHGYIAEIPGFGPSSGVGIGPMTQPNRLPQHGLKPKDLAGIPWRVAFALQDDGWWLRRDVIWHKPNPMPESTNDRCTTAHEYLFHFAKGELYYYDAEAIAEEASDNSNPRRGSATDGINPKAKIDADGARQNIDFTRAISDAVPATRNKRSVWTIATSPFPEAHFATFPPALVEPCILASTSAHGCCLTCGSGWERVTAEVDTGRRHKMPDGMATHAGNHETIHKDGREKGAAGNPVMAKQTLGFYPGCGCYGAQVEELRAYPPKPSRAEITDEDAYKAAMAAWREDCGPVTAQRRLAVARAMRECAVVPAVVGDPFAGAGTTLLVAERLGRDSVGCELNPEYARLAAGRIEADKMTKESGRAHIARAAGRVKGHGDLPLFAAPAAEA